MLVTGLIGEGRLIVSIALVTGPIGEGERLTISVGHRTDRRRTANSEYCLGHRADRRRRTTYKSVGHRTDRRRTANSKCQLHD